jgi:ketosteroid isomerase-like protein
MSWLCFLTAVIAAGPTIACAADCSQAVSQTKSFLDSYTRGDARAVTAMVEPDVVLYGSDIREIFHGPEGVRKMLAGDQSLWKGEAKLGELQQLSITSGADLCVLTFHAPFTLGARGPVQVRFTVAWRKGPDGWLLAQSANSTPTVGESAEELLAGKR